MARLQQMLLVAIVLGGCAAPRSPALTATSTNPQSTQRVQRLPTIEQSIQLASHTQPVESAVQEIASDGEPLPEPLPPGTIDEFSSDEALDVDRLVAEVVARNPSVQAMVAAWESAAARYPQAIALDDPMLDASVGPGSWGRSDLESAYMVMASQKFPWPGKRHLRGAVAGAEADEAATQIEEMQLRLALVAKAAYYDYFAAYRQLALNADNLTQTQEFRETAAAKLKASLVTQQDVLQADVELALLERRRNELQREVKVAAARINTLLHRDALTPLPPPVDELRIVEGTPPLDELRFAAIERRPELTAIAAQIQAEEAALALAWKEFFPDVEIYGKYDAFWQEEPLRPAVGVNVNLPLNKFRRHAAVREAESRLRQRHAEYQRLVDEIANEVHASYERQLESRRTLELYDERIVPTARQNVESAHAGYVAGKVDFLRLIEAQRQLIELREQQVETASDYHRRLAELERATAAPAPWLEASRP